jgi:hypothetical protein
MRAREVTMDALLGLRSSQWRATDWAAAAVSGFAAGAVLMVLDLVWSGIFNAHGPWRTSHMIAPLFIGTGTLKATGYAFSVGVVSIALATHYALGVVFGMVMAAIMVRLHLDETPGRAAAAGAIMGMALYLFNFEGLTRFFPWLAELRGGDTLAAHVVFGVVAALLYWRLKRTTAEP